MRVPFVFVPFAFACLCALGSSTAHAQAGEGEGEGEGTPAEGEGEGEGEGTPAEGEGEGEGATCDPATSATCTTVGTTPAVAFCGDTLKCDDADGVAGADGCAKISDQWGNDCVLGDGATCDPEYAFGLSRCDPTATDSSGQHLFCVSGKCTFAASRPA